MAKSKLKPIFMTIDVNVLTRLALKWRRQSGDWLDQDIPPVPATLCNCSKELMKAVKQAVK